MQYLRDSSPYGASTSATATVSGATELADVFDHDTHTNLLVPLASLAVTCGAALGETPIAPDDLILGDVIRIAHSAVTFPVPGMVGHSDELDITLPRVDIGMRTLRGAMVKTVIVMSDTGQTHHGQVFQTLTQGAFLLFDRAIAQGTEYTLIHEDYIHSTTDPQHAEFVGNVRGR